MRNYDYVFITNIPAFYKVNLFNMLSSKLKIKVIFIAKASKIREEWFYERKMRFEYKYINEGFFEDRAKLTTLYKIKKELDDIKYNRLVYPGWEIKELFFLSCVLPKKNNSVVIESSILDTKVSGLIWLLKRIYLKRMAVAYPSGILQKKILELADFQGDIFVTHGVGVSNYNEIKKSAEILPANNLPYLYIGRLSSEKNVDLLIDVFNVINKDLIIIGDGPERENLKRKARDNIRFLGNIKNKDINKVFEKTGVFILPSKTEPWGLVVEEALIAGIPVIISNKIGCKEDLVNEKNGIIFDLDQPESLINAIKKMEKKYEFYKKNALEFDIKQNYHKQLSAYCKAIS